MLMFQKTVFNDLGVGVYNNAWAGFNSTLFAYGQTGSGKSWSVVGYGVNKGEMEYCKKLCQNFSKGRVKWHSGPENEIEKVCFS